MKMPLVAHNPNLEKDIPTIISFINENQKKFGDLDDTFWNGRVIHYPNIDKDIQKILIKHKDFLLSKFYEETKETKEIYLDTLSLIRWVKGYELFPHADKDEPDGRPHPFPWRNYGSVTFLNEDFEGGVLYYPKLNDFQIPAKKGYFAIHKGDLDHLHGVTEITEGVRYTIGTFLTFEKDKSIRF